MTLSDLNYDVKQCYGCIWMVGREPTPGAYVECHDAHTRKRFSDGAWCICPGCGKPALKLEVARMAEGEKLFMRIVRGEL